MYIILSLFNIFSTATPLVKIPHLSFTFSLECDICHSTDVFPLLHSIQPLRSVRRARFESKKEREPCNLIVVSFWVLPLLRPQ